jgi:hypothetical protein
MMMRWVWVLVAGLLVVGGLSVAGGAPAGPTLEGGNVRVSKQDLITTDAFFSQVGPPPDVLQQNEPAVAVHPTNPDLVAVGMNDVRTLGLSNDAWQGLAVSTNGGASFDFEALIPGFPGDTSPQGLVSPIRGNRAASDPWLGFDPFKNLLFFAFIAFQRTPPGRPDFEPQDTNAIAVARYRVTGSGVVYDKTVVVERGTVGLGRQEDKEALAVDIHAGSPHRGNVYVCWARFTGAQDHLKVATSSDGGESYRLATIATASRTVLMQGCSLAVAPNGDVFVAWRTFDVNPLVSNPRDSAIFVAKSTNGGQTFGSAVEVARFVDYRQSTSRTPPVFRTIALTSIAADENGVYVAWQQRGPGGDADVVISRSRDGGQTWEAPVRPYVDPPAHQIMPSVAAAGGKLSVVWYDSRSEPAFTPRGPISGSCPSNATDGTGCRGLDVFYAQADTTASGPLQFGPALRITSQSFNPNLYGSIKAISPFIGDYIMVAANREAAFVVWTDNRNINPTKNAQEDADVTTDPPGLINFRSRDSNVYFQRVRK